MRRLKIYFLAAALAAAAIPAQAQDKVARGRYLAILGDCAGCHTGPHAPAFSGGLPFTTVLGTVYSTNITPDPETGLGNWCFEDFSRAIHAGVGKGGRHLYPAFPYFYFTRISTGDTEALWAYLKTLTPVRAPPRRNHLWFPFNIRALMTFWNWLYLKDQAYQPEASKSASWNRGAYLVTGLGHCAGCHTPKNILFGDEDSKAFTGAAIDNWFAANLTGNRHDGLGQWSQADVVQYLATGRNRYATAAGSMQEKVTLSTSRMTGEDRAAIATYLKSLAPVPLAAEKKPGAAQMRRGQAIFVAQCSACHAPPGQADTPAKGGLPDYPKLAGDTLVMGRDPTTVLRILLEGAESPVTPNEATTFSMPGFAAADDRALADVATYIRNAWGNGAPPVKPGQVADLRAAIAAAPQ